MPRALLVRWPRRVLPGIVSIALLGPLLGGCLAGGRPTPPDHFYQLGAPGASPPPVRPARPLVDSVVVRALRSDGLRQERAMLYSRDPQGLAMERLPYDYWADSPPELIKTYLVRALREAGIARMVTGDPVGRRPDLEIGGRLLHFEQIRQPGSQVGVRVELELLVEDARDGRVVLLEVFREHAAVAEERMGAVATAFRDALDRIIARFVAELAGRLGEG